MPHGCTSRVVRRRLSVSRAVFGATVLAAARGGVLVVDRASVGRGQGRDRRAGRPATTTTTQPTAIGLRTNADEQAEFGPDKPLTPAQRQQLADELVVARATALKYPTVADATKAGYILAGKFTPGAGAHYVSISDERGVVPRPHDDRSIPRTRSR